MIPQEHSPQPFNVEHYRGYVVDIVHIRSVQRVASRKKIADQSEVNAAIVILNRIAELEKYGVEVRYIDDLSKWQNPTTALSSKSLILGGAFEGQCLAEYQRTLTVAGISFRLDPLLTLRSGW